MRAGKHDRKITIKTATVTQGSSGQESPTWKVFHVTFAEWLPFMGQDRLKSESKHSYLSGRFRFRPFKAGVEHTMQVECEGTLYRIVGVAEIPRRKGVELTVEEWQ